MLRELGGDINDALAGMGPPSTAQSTGMRAPLAVMIQ